MQYYSPKMKKMAENEKNGGWTIWWWLNDMMRMHDGIRQKPYLSGKSVNTWFLHIYLFIYPRGTCRLPVTMVSYGAQSPSNELSDCAAQDLCRPIREPPTWRHFGALETICFTLTMGTSSSLGKGFSRSVRRETTTSRTNLLWGGWRRLTHYINIPLLTYFCNQKYLGSVFGNA